LEAALRPLFIDEKFEYGENMMLASTVCCALALVAACSAKPAIATRDTR
jgi:hypothetical protein